MGTRLCKCNIKIRLERMECLKNRNYKTREAINFEKILFLTGQKTIGFLTDKEFCGYV